ncbi:MAG: restriction endonuclease [Ignavibacterium sp.]|jgi:superfamily II DNA or RNA helicase|uniref:SNF2-related protein n=1 Tax=Ignavibacterium sp. TaxID=2651167 RepID=UPI003298A2CE
MGKKVPNLRVSFAKELSRLPRPKISKPITASFEYPELLDKTDEIEIRWEIGLFSEEARIPLPDYDVASSLIPLKSSTESIDVNPSTLMSLHSIEVGFQSVTVEFLDCQINTAIQIYSGLFAELTLDKLSIFGMNYADKHWRKIAMPKNDNAAEQKLEKSKEQKREGTFVEPKKRGRKSKVEQSKPSIWDLLFAVLQPPLTFGQSENLLLPNSPYPYQWQGIKFLMDNDHALLADDMGTGKTVMTTVALKILIQQTKVHHVLILCPPSVLYEWKRHLDDWAPELTSYLIRSPQKEVRKSLWETPMHVYVTTYDMLKGDIENGILSKGSLAHFDVVILDEAHHIKNMKSKRFRAIKQLQPKRRWALTGTPVQNKIEDLASIFEFVYPNYLTSFDLQPERVKERIKPYFLRRRKKEVMPELPPKIPEIIELELDEEQDIAYRQAEAGIREELSALGDKVTKQHIFAKLTILKQICNFAPKKSSSPKTESLKERIEEIIANGEKVIVFSQYVDEGVSKLEKLLEPYGVAKIVGGQTDSVRRNEIEKFKKRKDVPVLIASVRSGGEGLNLIEASYVVHFDHWWNPAVMWQAEDRVHRRGQTKGVNIYSYWMKDTIDDRIRQKLREKGILFEQIVDGLAEEGIDELFTVNDWLEIFGVKNVEVAKKPIIDVKIWQLMSLSEIREKLYEIKPSEFEELVRELMHYLGYPNVKVTGKSHDGGIDVLSTRNTPNGIERVAAQCKRYRGNVSVHVARDFFGAVSNDKSIKQGFLVTTGEFTAECLQFCQSSGMIKAISGIELAKYVQQFGLSA